MSQVKRIGVSVDKKLPLAVLTDRGVFITYRRLANLIFYGNCC